MSKTIRLPFMGREIELRVVPCGVTFDAADMMNAGKPILDVMWHTLCPSAYWVDTGERAFKDRDACRATPNDHMHELLSLGRAAMDLNKANYAALQEKEAPPPPVANGHDNGEPPAPSL
jgi:hypothetical protein